MTIDTVGQWISTGDDQSIRKNVAVRFCDGNLAKILTHADVSSLADAIQNEILKLHIHEGIILIDSEETLLTIPLLFGILQSNNAFFVCDAHWPENILRDFIKQLQPSALICQRQNKPKIYDLLIQQARSSSIILLDQQIDVYQIPAEIKDKFCYRNIAYVVASSGSTGIPKLIAVSHACILPNLIQLKSIFDVTQTDCLFRSTPLTFDPSFVDIFLARQSGACLIILSTTTRRHPALAAQLFNQNPCTIAQMTPSFFRQIHRHCEMIKLKTLILGGEPFPPLSNGTIRQLIEQGKRVINIYGLTEMSCWASYHILTENDLQRTDGVPLGQALDQTSLVLRPSADDEYFQVILESQTRWTQFVQFSSERRYVFETDDLVRRNKNGEIFYIGRRTLTGKRFGVMINLEYIEQIAFQSDLLDECVALLEIDSLILLCKFKTETPINKLEIFLQQHLSDHFLPNRILSLESNFPLNMNGKIDRSQLMTFRMKHSGGNEEKSLNNIWQSILNQKPDLESNFIVNGGNSLLALTFVERIQQANQSIDANRVFDLLLHKTFADLIDYLDNRNAQPVQIQNFPSNSISTTASTSGSGAIRSIQRCSQIFLHDRLADRSTEIPLNGLKFHWKQSMIKCIDSSPLIVIIDEQQSPWVIIGSHAGLVHAYRIEDGQLIWSFQANDRIEASAALSRHGEFVLIGDYSGMLYIIDCLNGQLFSSYQCQDLIKTIPCIHPTLELVFIGAHDQFIHAIQIQKQSSTCIWRAGIGASCVSSPQLSSDGNRLYVGSLAGDVFALEAITGDVVWKQSLGKPIFSTISIWNDQLLLIGCVDHKFYCLNCINGEKKWTFATDGPIFSSPCLRDNMAFVGCHDRFLYAIDLSGVLRWKCQFPSMIYASPFVFHRLIIVGSTDGCLRVLNSQTGEILSEISVDGHGLFSSPVCHLDFVLVGSRDDHLYCYKLS